MIIIITILIWQNDPLTKSKSQPLTKSSSATMFLEQKLSLTKNPFSSALTMADAKAEDMLYVGVSCEDQGRKAYLKRRRQMDPHEKTRFPRQESQEVGWIRDVMMTQSQFARRPLVKDNFFRKNGIPLKVEAWRRPHEAFWSGSWIIMDYHHDEPIDFADFHGESWRPAFVGWIKSAIYPSVVAVESNASSMGHLDFREIISGEITSSSRQVGKHHVSSVK